jgi:AcrR family transcriptional regulator
MVEAAFQLVRRDGYDALTARSLAAELGCSTQPIMYRFPDLTELKALVYQKADAYHTAYLFSAEDLLGIGLRYVQFAAEETNLFRLLFQSGRFDGASLAELIAAPEAGELIRATSLELGLSKEDALSAFEALYVAVHGYASLIANNAMSYDPHAIGKTLTAIAEGLLRGKDDRC